MAGAAIRIPDPSLVVLIGAAGAGKSTFARRWFAPAEILSSDALRAELGHGEADQRVSRIAFAVLHERLRARLAAGRLTVVDATNLLPGARRAVLARRPDASFPTIALVFDPPPDTVRDRNASRGERTVPRAVVERQLAAMLRVSEELLRAEGFEARGIHRIVDGSTVEVVRGLVRS